jgi:hypothetical protein
MTNQIEWPYHLIQSFMKVSHLGGLQQEFLDLTKESFEGLQHGLNRSAVIVAGEALYRLNCILLTTYIVVMTDIGQKVANKKLNKLQTENLGDFDIAQKLIEEIKITLDDSISILKELELIDEELYENMTILRHLRNKTTHVRIPNIYDYSPPFKELGLTIEEVLNTPEQLEPLKWTRYRFFINIKKDEDKLFTINPEKLMIDLRDIEYTKFAPTVSLAILFLSIKNTIEKVNDLFSLIK